MTKTRREFTPPPAIPQCFASREPWQAPPKGQQTMVAAGLRQALLQPDQDGAHRVWRSAADQFRDRWPKLGAFMDDSEHDVLAFMALPAQHHVKLRSTNPLERLNREVKRRADVVGIFPNDLSIRRLIGAVLLEANDEWTTQNCYMQVEPMAELLPRPSRVRSHRTTPPKGHPKPHDRWPPQPSSIFHHLDGHYLSIHAPVQGATSLPGIVAMRCGCFDPRPRAGGDAASR